MWCRTRRSIAFFFCPCGPLCVGFCAFFLPSATNVWGHLQPPPSSTNVRGSLFSIVIVRGMRLHRITVIWTYQIRIGAGETLNGRKRRSRSKEPERKERKKNKQTRAFVVFSQKMSHTPRFLCSKLSRRVTAGASV